jgi:hypothetical protein
MTNSAARNYRRQNRRVPEHIRTQVHAWLAASIVGQGIKAGETLKDLVDRAAPDLYGKVRALGYELDFDLPENTHTALCRSDFYLLITPLVSKATQ